MSEPLLLQAFKGTHARVPVWFMRQAGRSLPEYRAIRENHTLNEMFHHPELAARITCQPVERLGVDAAILFADILTLPSAMGFEVEFSRGGPMIHNPIRSVLDLKRVRDYQGLGHIAETLRLTRQMLRPETAIIGFAGSPFSVLAYLFEEGPGLNLRAAVRFAYESPREFELLMWLLTRNTIRYLRAQKEAGAQVYQLFDSWAGMLRAEDYRRWVLPTVREIFRQVGGPSIYYVKHGSHLLEAMKESGADVLSFCETVDLGADARLQGLTQGVQGNLYNGLLYAPIETILEEARRILRAGQRFPAHIFNLSHGVLPDMDPDKLKRVVEEVHAFDREACGAAHG